MDSKSLLEEFVAIKTQRDILAANLRQKCLALATAKALNATQVKARWVITEVQAQTQRRFQDQVESLVTMAIQSVFSRPFTFHIEFERYRNRLACKTMVKEGDRVYDDPEYDLGGGVLDIVSFAFRVVLWSLQTPRSRAVIVFDEPMKNMGALIDLAGKVFWEISHKLNLQLIIVTHDEKLIEIGDRVFRITHDGTKSQVEIIRGKVEIENVGGAEEKKPRKIAR